MSKTQLDEYFGRYVFKFMFADIGREIRCAEAQLRGERDEGGGNFLAALGLLCYTEALGKLVKANFATEANSSAFTAFFDRLGSGQYAAWRQDWESKWGRRVEDAFRNGMAHEYLPKHPARVIMLGKALPGLGQDDPPDGPLFFFVEAYFRDFEAAARELYLELSDLINPQVPML